MQIVYLPEAAKDIAWLRYYYRSVFPEGSAKARAHLKAIQQTLAAHPFVGHPLAVHPSAAQPSLRELTIPRTPFTLIYRVTADQIEVLRLWDNRQGTGY